MARRPNSAKLPFTLLVISLVAASGCDNALRGSGGAGSTIDNTHYELTFAFDDGSAESTVVMGALSRIELALPTVGYSRVLSVLDDLVDPARLAVSPSVDLGDVSGDFIAAGTNIATTLHDLGRLHALEMPDGRPGIAIEIDDGELPAFPIGRMLWTVTVLDDIDRVSNPLQVGLTVRAPDRPTVALSLQIPPFGSTVPTGVSLPIDEESVPYIGKSLDFVLALRLIPNPESGAIFESLVVDGAIDIARVSVVANRNLGDPKNGGFDAGTNVAALLGADLDVLVDAETGEMTITLLFPVGAAYSPLLGDTQFTISAMDDADVRSFDQAISLRAVTPVKLSANVQSILTSKCATTVCHDNSSPAAGMRLNSGRTFGDTVRIRSGQTPEDSCAANRIEPYVLDASYFWHKLMDTHEDPCVGGSGGDMPPTGNLTAGQLATIEDWILQGAHDN